MRIPIVNENDEILEYKDRSSRLPNEITRVASLWLGNEKGEILLAQRSFKKKDSPGLWGPAVAGSVEEGETYESNIIKEAEEEIGLKKLIPIEGPKHLRHTSHRYFSQVFFVIVPNDYPFIKQDEEVEEIRWFNKEELFKLLEEKPEMFLKSVKKSAEDFFKFYDSQS
jgi:isopentenyldiphosphate isomerase